MGDGVKAKHRYLRVLASVCALAAVAAGLLVIMVWNGWILLNHPSPRQYPVRGVDVSHYQGEIDWEILGGQDIDFAYIKATEGSSHVDEKFSQNWEDSSTSGLAAGAYHFFSFDSSGQEQLKHFVQTLPVREDMLAPAVDVEFYGDKQMNPPDPNAVEEELSVLLEGLTEQYGMTPVIYATEESWNLYIRDRFDQYPLWIRNVKTRPHTDGKPWLIWQYTNRKQLPGYKGDERFIDMNVFYGSREQWETWSQAR